MNRAKLETTKTALVTGGAGGIGFELCKLIAEDGYDLVIVDMNELGMNRAAQKLHTEYGINVETIAKDLSKAEAPREIVQELFSRGIEIDILVNNAGYGLSGDFVEMSLEKQLNMLHVNIDTVVSLTSLLLPSMMKREGAKVLNLASIAAFQPGPYMASYFASKAFVLSWTEALAKELEDTNVSVTALCPPPTDTGFANRAGSGNSIAFKKGVMAGPEQVAADAWNGMRREKTIVLPGWFNRFSVFVSRFLPRSVVAGCAGVMNKQRSTQGAMVRQPRATIEVCMQRAS